MDKLSKIQALQEELRDLKVRCSNLRDLIRLQATQKRELRDLIRRVYAYGQCVDTKGMGDEQVVNMWVSVKLLRDLEIKT